MNSNLEVVQLYCAISGFWECATQSWDCTITQIAQNIYCMARNFHGTKFLWFSRICLRLRKLTVKILPTTQTTPFSFKAFWELASVCAMAMYRYFSSVDKLPKLPDATGSLPTKVPSSSIVLANAGMKSVLKSLLAKGKGLCQAVARSRWQFIISGSLWHGSSLPMVASLISS